MSPETEAPHAKLQALHRALLASLGETYRSLSNWARLLVADRERLVPPPP